MKLKESEIKVLHETMHVCTLQGMHDCPDV